MTTQSPDATEQVERVADAIEKARCGGREGPFGGYDYGHNPGFYGPPPEGGRYVIRDFRDPASPDWGKWLHQTDDHDEHEALFAKMTREHLARAAIAALPSNATSNECPECEGRGEVWAQAAGLPRAPSPVQCDYCHGTGTMAISGETPPLFDDATTNASLVEALKIRDVAADKCPIQKGYQDVCPACKATSSDTCGLIARADIEFVAAVRATLRASNPDEEGR